MYPKLNILMRFVNEKTLPEQQWKDFQAPYAANYTCARNVYVKSVARQSLFLFQIKG